MKIYDTFDEEGRVFAFEVTNFTRKRAAAFIATIPGAEVTRWPRRTFFSQEDDFCEFIIAGKRFVATEMWGDNSRYWIGPNPPEWCQEVEIVRSAFANYRPKWLFGIF